MTDTRMLPIRSSFGFNTNVLETNVLNLAVVIGIVITFVGDAVRTLLDQRLQTVLSTLQAADQKARHAQARLDEARRRVETARKRSEEIRIQTIHAIEHENQARQKRLEEDLQRLRERSLQSIRLERQRIIRDITVQVGKLAVIAAENTLLTVFGDRSPTCSRQKDLNASYMRKISHQLKTE